MTADFDAIGADLATTVAAVSGVRSCVYPPPEQAPIQGVSCWVDLAATFDTGNLEIGTVAAVITVATPRKGDYPREYRLVLATAREIVIAFRGNIAVAGDAMIVPPMEISKPVSAAYAEPTPNIVACTVAFAMVTEEETVNQLVL